MSEIDSGYQGRHSSANGHRRKLPQLHQKMARRWGCVQSKGKLPLLSLMAVCLLLNLHHNCQPHLIFIKEVTKFTHTEQERAQTLLLEGKKYVLLKYLLMDLEMWFSGRVFALHVQGSGFNPQHRAHAPFSPHTQSFKFTKRCSET